MRCPAPVIGAGGSAAAALAAASGATGAEGAPGAAGAPAAGPLPGLAGAEADLSGGAAAGTGVAISVLNTKSRTRADGRLNIGAILAVRPGQLGRAQEVLDAGPHRIGQPLAESRVQQLCLVAGMAD